MKLTIEMDPIQDRALFDRVMAAVMDHPAPVTMQQTGAVSMNMPDVEEEAPDFRPYGEPGDGRKRRSKEEKAVDDEIDALAAKTDIAIRTDIPAEDMLQELKDATSEEEPSEADAEEPKQEEEGFDLGDSDEPISLEDFRAAVIKINQKHGKDAVAILAQYGKGVGQIPEDKRREVLDRLAELDA